MIEEIYGAYIGTCDICQKETKECETWDKVRDWMSKNDWATYKVDGEWCNVCPECGGCD